MTHNHGRSYCLASGIACAILTLLAFDAPTSLAAELSGREILEKSQAVMAPPVEYRISTGNIEMLVWHKLLSDGSPAMRTATSSPIEKISLLVGDESYEFFPEQGVAIDTHFMYQAAKGQAASISSALGGRAASSAEVTGTTERDGKQCFIVEAAVPNDVAALVGKALPGVAQGMLPRAQRFVIQKDTYAMVEMEVVAQSGVSISKSRFKDIKRRPDLTDDLFLLPDGLEVQKPATIGEYVAVLTKIFSPKVAVGRPKPALAQRLKAPAPRRLGPTEIDPATGRLIPPAPPGMHRDEFDRLVAEKRTLLAAERKQQQPGGMNSSRVAGVFTTLALAFVYAGVAFRRRLARKAASR